MTPKVILVMIDACRPDALPLAHTPNIDALARRGAYTWAAQTIATSISLPAHTSLFRGVAESKHGVYDNLFVPAASSYPSVIDLIHQAGKHAAFFYSWEQLRDLCAPGSLAMSFCRRTRPGEDTDHRVAEAAMQYLTAEQPDFLFVYVDKVDITGHACGWMSPEYLDAIARADRQVGLVRETLAAQGLEDQYVVIVMADHGGHGHVHGDNIPDDILIPWIISGPGIKQGHEIQAPVMIYDTAATIAHLLGLPLPPSWEGRPVIEALA